MRTLTLALFAIFLGLCGQPANAQLLPPSVSAPIAINGNQLSGPVTQAQVQKLLHDNLGQPITMYQGDNQVRVRNCADWISYTARNYGIVGDGGYGNYTYNTTCTQLLFLEFATAGNDNLNPNHPLNLKDADLIPANILPTLHTSVDEYTGYKNDNTSLGMLAASGNIQLSSEHGSESSPSILVTCTKDPECETLSETLTEVARGDFLHSGSRQILVREDDHNPGGDGSYGNWTGFVLFSRTSDSTPYKAFMFRLDCMSSTMQNLATSTPVPCVTAWPQIPSPASSLITSAPALKPGFDCAKAARPFEHLVCSDAHLAEQDAELNVLYHDALAGMPQDKQTSFRLAQRQWLHSVMTACRLPRTGTVDSASRPNTVACLSNQYGQRIGALQPHYTISTAYSFPDHTAEGPGIMLPDGAGGFYITASGDYHSCWSVLDHLTPPPNSQGSWTQSQLYCFAQDQGGHALTAGPDGNLYGFAWDGAFRLSAPATVGASWQRTIIFTPSPRHSFGFPPISPMVFKNGALYGIAGGELFELSQASPSAPWQEHDLLAANGVDLTNLLVGRDGSFYGVTEVGGAPNCPTDIGDDCGAIFAMTETASGTWSEKIIYQFQGHETGGTPNPALVQGPDGSLYGTTSRGGGQNLSDGTPCDCGVVFRLSPPPAGQRSWAYSVLHSFAGRPRDGSGALGYRDQALTLDPSGAIFGLTKAGGSFDGGVIFELEPAPPSQEWPETIFFSFQGQMGMPAGITNMSSTPLLEFHGDFFVAASLDHPGFGGTGQVLELSPATQ